MVTLRDLAARRPPPPRSFAVRVWDPVRITWVVEGLTRYRQEPDARSAAEKRAQAGERVQVVEVTAGCRIVFEIGGK